MIDNEGEARVNNRCIEIESEYINLIVLVKSDLCVFAISSKLFQKTFFSRLVALLAATRYRVE